jgi:signal transduction histidine kinase
MRARTVGRLAWPLLALFLSAAVAGSVLQEINGPTGVSDYFTAVGFTVIGVFGAFLASRRPENLVGWLFLGSSFCAALGFVLTEYAEFAIADRPDPLPGGVAAAWLSGFTWLPALVFLGVFLLLLFPDGRLPSRRWRVVAWGAAAALALMLVSLAILPGDLDVEVPVDNPYAIPSLAPVIEVVASVAFVLIGVFAVLSGASLVFRYRRSGREERHQLKWFLFAGLYLALNLALVDFLPEPVSNVTFISGLFLLPAAATVAVLKYRLYDIDVVINKALVFGALAVFFTLVYMAVVVGVGALIGSQGSLALSVGATAIIAVAFQPVRDRARRFANRLVYGERATPYEVLSEFSGRMAGTYSTEDVLPRMVRLMAEGTGARRAEVWLRVGPELRRAAAHPGGDDPPPLTVRGDDLPPIPSMEHVYPVRHQSELLGALTVTKPPGEPLTPTEDKLVQDIAAQAGLVLRNVRLIEEIRASRHRLVTAQDEERRRLERNIHDGAQQQLVSLAVKLRLARSSLAKDPVQADLMLQSLESDAAEAMENLRDLARGVYPPLLADQGLAAALQAQARKTSVPVEIEPDGIGRYPQEAEAAVYFCVLEALQNVAKYAQASKAVVRLSATDRDLRFEVSDDGVGFDPAATARGSGTQNMADRVAALGGELDIRSQPDLGTTIRGRIPAHTLQAGASEGTG